MVETLGPLQGNHEVFKEGALVKRPLLEQESYTQNRIGWERSAWP